MMEKENVLTKKLKDISPNVPRAAQDIMVSDMLALARGTVTERTGKLTVTDLKGINTALRVGEVDVEMAKERGTTISCCCCLACCCCCA